MGNCDLVLEGGGVKGIGLVGAISALWSAGYHLGDSGRVAGTSAGAIVGSLLAAGMSPVELEVTLRGIDYRRLSRPHVGRGDNLYRWISDRLASRGIRTFADLRLDSDLASALPPSRSYRLVVLVSDVSRGCLLRLPWDYVHYGLDPDTQPVADAVWASAAIPFFLHPTRLSGTPSSWVDGGILSNYPIDLFDRADGILPRWPTLGIKLSARAAVCADTGHPLPVRGRGELSRALISTMVEAHDRLRPDDPAVRDRTIFVDSEGVRATDFDLDAERQNRLFDSGQQAAEKFLAGVEFRAQLRGYDRRHRARC